MPKGLGAATPPHSAERLSLSGKYPETVILRLSLRIRKREK
jgi:hypothetical protein